MYWYAYTDGTVGKDVFVQSIGRLALYAAGNCFPTQEEAEAHKDEVISRLKSIYANGREEQKPEKPSVGEAVKVLKEYCVGRACSHCKFCMDKENGEGCRLDNLPISWPI